MATVAVISSCSRRFNFFNFSRYKQICYRVSNFRNYSNKTDKEKPLQFSGSKASKISAYENYTAAKKKTLWYEKIVFGISLAVCLIYFCILREENDLDELISGNPEHQSDFSKLFNLQIQLQYCQKNNLPSANLEKKIESLKKKLNIAES